MMTLTERRVNSKAKSQMIHLTRIEVIRRMERMMARVEVRLMLVQVKGVDRGKGHGLWC